MIASSRLASGTYSVQVQQSDAAGNVGYSGANTFTVDTTPPVVSLSSPTNGSFTGTRPQFSGMAGTHPGDLRSVTVKLWFGFNTTGGAWQKETATVQADGSYSVASLVLGHRTYKARAEQSDAVGNVGFSAPTTFTVDNP